MFPPESVPVRVLTVGVRTSNSRTSSPARSSIAPRWMRPCFQNGCSPIRFKKRFRATGNELTIPSPNLSSVT